MNTPPRRSSMGRLLRQHDFVYERAPLAWHDGLPIANGNLGAMIWGDGRPLRFTLDSYRVWETRTEWPGDDPRFTYANLRRLKEAGRIEELHEIALRRRQMRFTENPPPHPTRLSLGRLEIRWPETPRQFGARLDLRRATAGITLQFPKGRATVSSFVGSTQEVLVVTVRGGSGVPVPRVSLLPAPTDEDSRRHFRSWKYPDPEVREQPGRHILFRRYASGKEYSMVAEEVRADHRLTVFVTLVSGEDGSETTAQACQRLAAMRQAGVATLRREHEADWERFWDRSAIRLPDRRMEQLFYAEMYKHYCSSRPGPDHLPITLQGLWTTDGAMPPWRGSYTTDMNVQESYWPIYASNHLESGSPLYGMYFRNLPSFRKLGKYFYGKEIAIVPSEHGPGGEPFPGYFTDEHSPGNGAWIAHSFWQHWLYSRDTVFLRQRAYPFLKEMAQAYLHIAERRADGKTHIPFTDSPEFYCGRPESLGDDSNYDLALLRFLLEALLEAQPHLEQPDPEWDRWRELLNHLVDYPTCPTALYRYSCLALGPNEPAPDPKDHQCLAIRVGEPLPHTHRHHSHLIGIYPLGVIDSERSEYERNLVERSLEDLVFHGTGEWMGWSFPWASLIAGRAGKAQMAYRFLQTYLDGFVLPNSLHTNSDPDERGICARKGIDITLEAGFAAAAAILEMLLQSHKGLIRIFPTCPRSWGDAQFVNLRAEGAFLVSAKMADHRVRFVEISSEVGGLCRIRNPFGGQSRLADITTGASRALKGSLLEFSTRPGGRYLLTQEGAERSVQPQ